MLGMINVDHAGWTQKTVTHGFGLMNENTQPDERIRKGRITKENQTNVTFDSRVVKLETFNNEFRTAEVNHGWTKR